MQIIRYASAAGAAVAVDDGRAIRPLPVRSIAELLIQPRDRMREILDRAGQAMPPRTPIRMLPPVDGLTEVWACGVTYERSSTARQEESQVADVYARVYDAERPELFFKSPAWRVCGPGEPIGIRPDSEISVPEPELALACSSSGEIVGVTICNDVSSRSIEGENPLYLPQAKIYLGGCAAGPWIRPAWEVPDPHDLSMQMTITRDGAAAWDGQASTRGLRRTVAELARFLFREDEFPAGVLLSTGTSLVPDLPFSLREGDEIRISIDGIGELVNPVVRGKAALAAGQGV